MRRFSALALTTCLALAVVPGAALAQSAGDDQYVDPLNGTGGTGSGGGSGGGSGSGTAGAAGSSSDTGSATATGGSASGGSDGSAQGSKDTGRSPEKGAAPKDAAAAAEPAAQGVATSASGMPAWLIVLAAAGAVVLAGGLLLRWRIRDRR